jgi:hypothetical protein
VLAMQGQNITTEMLVYGWTNQPNGRGTIDILWSCLCTIFLCSWTVLCLNLPAQGGSFWRLFRRKLRWMAITIFGPELLLSIAVGQWASARQSVRAFALSGYPQWTTRHAFFADMGGLVLQAPDFPKFPINAKQLHYLVAAGYLPYPQVDKEVISDKNKADGFARAITVMQTIWFVLQCISRVNQSLALTHLELSTLAFVFCTLATFFSWFHKPLDIEIPIVLETSATIADILIKGGEDARKPYQRTPLDFVDPTAVYWSDHIFTKVAKTGAKKRPIERSTNDRMCAVGRSLTDLCMFSWILAFACIHFGAWNFIFATQVENILWRASAFYYVGFAFYHWLVVYFVPWCEPKNPTTTIPSSVFYTHALGLVFYGFARMYMIAESFAALRVMPASAFESVEWSSYLPHV